jgi:hypothetical protein
MTEAPKTVNQPVGHFVSRISGARTERYELATILLTADPIPSIPHRGVAC